MDRTPDKWLSHLRLDLEGITHLIMTRSSGSISRDIYIDRVEPAATFCTMSSDHLFDDSPAPVPQTFSHGSVSLAALARAKKHVGSGLRGITPQDAATTRRFEVFIDCYASKNIIEAKVRYALNKFYDPSRERRSAEACNRKR
jgi:hypothetical protein